MTSIIMNIQQIFACWVYTKELSHSITVELFIVYIAYSSHGHTSNLNDTGSNSYVLTTDINAGHPISG